MARRKKHNKCLPVIFVMVVVMMLVRSADDTEKEEEKSVPRSLKETPAMCSKEGGGSE